MTPNEAYWMLTNVWNAYVKGRVPKVRGAEIRIGRDLYSAFASSRVALKSNVQSMLNEPIHPLESIKKGIVLIDDTLPTDSLIVRIREVS